MTTPFAGPMPDQPQLDEYSRYLRRSRSTFYLVRLWNHYRWCRGYFGAFEALQCARRLAKAHST